MRAVSVYRQDCLLFMRRAFEGRRMKRKRMWGILLLCLLLAGCGVPQNKNEATGEKTEAFILGADVSSLPALEESGVRYYNEAGEETDLLTLLADAGVNCLRVRVWVDPFDAEGHGYGGGNCTADTAADIGARGAELGMKLLVDFHYSDFWADPGKQQVPKAWADLHFDRKVEALQAYTRESLETIKKAGADIAMVQLGNEINNGLCGETTPGRVYALLKAGAEAVRDFDAGIAIVLHYTNPERGDFEKIAEGLEKNGVDYDVFATSYYPNWHGSVENLGEQLRAVAEGYGKKVLAAETAWACTAADGDGHPNTLGAGDVGKAPYDFSPQGQEQAFAAVCQAVKSAGELGLGVFYWEPGWVPVTAENASARQFLWETFGSGWASSYAGDYDPEDAGKYYGGSAVDNQALFDFTGHPLPSLHMFRRVKESLGEK